MNGESQNPVEDQIVWQLEMWKRAEMAKFLAHLKQKEIQKIEEVMMDVMFEIPSLEDVTKVRITKEAVDGKAAPVLETA